MQEYTRRGFMKKVGLTITSAGLLTSRKNIEAKAETGDVLDEELLGKMTGGPCYSGACCTDTRDFPDLWRKDRD